MENTKILPIPEKFEVTENFGELTISYKWNKVAGIVMFVFSLIWNGMLFFIMSKMPSNFIQFTIIHAAVGVYLFYYGLCQLVNTTSIICTNDELNISIKPIPFFGNKKISSNDISQLYFSKREIRNKNSTTIVYDLHMLDKNNRSARLLKTLPTAENARYIESKLEKFYKIKNIEVAGEYR